MLRLAPGIKVYLACQPVDLRRGFDGLSAEVGRVLAADPYSRAAFVFRGKRGDYVKILTWDGSGLCLFAKRLEKGKFRLAADRRRRAAIDGGATGSVAGRHRLAPHGRAAADGAPADRLSGASHHKNQATPREMRLRRRRDCGGRRHVPVDA